MALKVLIWIGLLAGFLVGATAWRAGSLARSAEAAYPPEGSFVELDGTRLHFVQEGTGPDLILIHGASGSTRDFTFQMLDALRDSYRVTIFDRPGFGYSDRVEGASIADQAALMSAAVAEIGVSRPIILGQSYGGAVALAWAVADLDAAGLVLVSAASNPWTTGLGTYYEMLSSPAGLALMAPLISAWVPDAAINRALMAIYEPNEPPEGYGAYIGPRISMRLPTLRENAMQRRSLLGEIADQVVHYPEITLPVEILHGTEDTIVPAATHSEPLSRQLPNAELTLLEGIGHMPHHVALAPVLEAIDRVALRAGLR